ncbi:hypothetical protein CYMTET_22833 [Cymbomonas tetramitiformis]|uniref:Plastid lipid-associated protein/fibrillin conserved domain-containing protein n=1 Tax=Cymbomonas tetramitiformis TaxID=36881 RepID=A0AAE0FZE8_9CHLO|nr:hypothetical protein CYMTET_22833 [Cymbomonas tetramitiformis]
MPQRTAQEHQAREPDRKREKDRKAWAASEKALRKKELMNGQAYLSGVGAKVTAPPPELLTDKAKFFNEFKLLPPSLWALIDQPSPPAGRGMRPPDDREYGHLQTQCRDDKGVRGLAHRPDGADRAGEAVKTTWGHDPPHNIPHFVDIVMIRGAEDVRDAPPGKLTVQATYTVTSPTKVDINYEQSTLVPEQLDALFKKNFDLLLAIFNPEGWLEIVYLDDAHRIGYDDKGNIFVLEKM